LQAHFNGLLPIEKIPEASREPDQGSNLRRACWKAGFGVSCSEFVGESSANLAGGLTIFWPTWSWFPRPF